MGYGSDNDRVIEAASSGLFPLGKTTQIQSLINCLDARRMNSASLELATNGFGYCNDAVNAPVVFDVRHKAVPQGKAYSAENNSGSNADKMRSQVAQKNWLGSVKRDYIGPRPPKNGHETVKRNRSDLTAHGKWMDIDSHAPRALFQKRTWIACQMHSVTALAQSHEQGKKLILTASPYPLCIYKQK